MSLFKLPCVARQASGTWARRMLGDHLRHRGLAVGAGHGDQRQAELRAPAGGQPGQRLPGIGHHQTRQTGLAQFSTAASPWQIAATAPLARAS